MGHGRETKGHLSTVEDGDKVIKGVHEGINIFSTIDLLTVSILTERDTLPTSFPEALSACPTVPSSMYEDATHPRDESIPAQMEISSANAFTEPSHQPLKKKEISTMLVMNLQNDKNIIYEIPLSWRRE